MEAMCAHMRLGHNLLDSNNRALQAQDMQGPWIYVCKHVHGTVHT